MRTDGILISVFKLTKFYNQSGISFVMGNNAIDTCFVVKGLLNIDMMATYYAALRIQINS